MGEAKGIRRAVVLAVAILAGVVGCSSSAMSPTATAARLPCTAKPTGGLCVRVIAHHLQVDDVFGYLVSSEPRLAGKTWRLVLTSYRCNPGYALQPRCSASGEYPGPARQGLPPAATSCRARGSGAVVTAPPGCHDTVAQASGSQGDWSGFAPLSNLDKPVVFQTPVWLCVSEQLSTGNGWREASGRSSPTPPRACQEVTP